jgi:hypothetical protein
MMVLQAMLVPPGSTNTAMESGRKSVLILMVRLLVIGVDGVCRFPLTAAAWPSARTGMTGLEPMLVTRGFTR